MNKTKNKILLTVLIILLVIGSFFGGYFSRYFTIDKELRGVYDLVNKYKKYYYFDDGDLVKEISDAILDDYSTYYTKEEYQAIINEAKGYYEGIGLSFYKNSLKIYKVLGNSPSEKAGIKGGGNLVAVKYNESYIDVDSLEEFTSILGQIPNNTNFIINIDYNGTVKEYTIQKQSYKRSYVHYYDSDGYYGFVDISGEFKMEKLNNETIISDSSVGYLVYDSFSGTSKDLSGSAKQMEEALKKFKNDNKTNLILDLRDNGGGYMDILCKVSSHFIDIENGKTAEVSYSIDKNGIKKSYYSKACDYSDYNFNNIVVLANENTASASEALIGAMLDYDKQNKVKVLVSSSIKNGQTVYKTYGKGIMQNTYKNTDGSAVKLTVAEIFWPISKTSIHKVGIVGKQDGKILAVDKSNALNQALNIINNF